MDFLEDNDLIQQLKQLRDDYYNTSPKNNFFKNSQKLLCAETVSRKFDITDLLNKTAYIIDDTPCIFFDYTIFKLYANKNNYENIVSHMLKLYDDCIEKYDEYSIFTDLNTFSISALERYKSLIILFNEKCKMNLNYSQKLKCWKILNSPSFFDTVSQILFTLIDKEVIQKIQLISKKENEILCISK